MTIKKFDHVGIQVKNMTISRKFYEDVIGLHLIDEIIIPNGPKLLFLGLNNEIIVELIEGKNSDFPSEGRVHHLAFTVEGIEKEFERIKSLNVQLLSEGVNEIPNGAKNFFLEGPDHERLEFFQPA